MQRALLGAVLAGGLALAGCQSTQDKSAALARKAAKLQQQSDKGLKITAPSRTVQIVGASVVDDSNGAATVVVLRNRTGVAQTAVPIGIDLLGAGGRSVFKNDTPGLDPSLITAPVIGPHAELEWVNDQISPQSAPRSVRAQVGPSGGQLSGSLPRIDVAGPVNVASDPVSGTEVSGSVVNRSKIEQLHLFIYCIARKGGRVVAAGRGELQRLKAGQKATFHIYPIGNPRGAQITIVAPPVSFSTTKGTP